MYPDWSRNIADGFVSQIQICLIKQCLQHHFGGAFFMPLEEVVIMDGITELAKLLKERENGTGYSPVFGKIYSIL